LRKDGKVDKIFSIVRRIEIKPLSVNEAWQGQRFKTALYKKYEVDLGRLLPRMEIPEGRLEVYYRFGLSSNASDYDNCIKQFQDILSKKYGFNDNRIYRAIIEKVDVNKKEEFIEFSIKKYG